MFIKKARIYKNTEATTILPEALESFRFTELLASESTKFGFYPAYGENLIHEAAGHKLIVVREDSKILPTPVIKAEVAKRAEIVSANLGRPISRKERAGITEEVLIDLLPRAFVRQKYIQAIITKSGYIVINGSASDAEKLLALLRKAIGSLPVIPLVSAVKERPDWELNEIVKKKRECENFAVGSQFEFHGSDDVVLKFKGLGSESDEVQGATEYGVTTKIELSSRHGICFTINDECALSGIQWSEELESRADGEDKAAIFDSQFFISAETFSSVANDLVALFGGFGQSTESK